MCIKRLGKRLKLTLNEILFISAINATGILFIIGSLILVIGSIKYQNYSLLNISIIITFCFIGVMIVWYSIDLFFKCIKEFDYNQKIKGIKREKNGK